MVSPIKNNPEILRIIRVCPRSSYNAYAAAKRKQFVFRSYLTMEKRPARSIEVELISGEGLCLGTRPMKKKAFVVLKTDDESRERATSKMASVSGGVISWGSEKLCLFLPYRSRLLIVEVYTSGKLVGSSRIPVCDFVGGYRPENQVQFLSHRLRDGYGVKNGIINISVKVKTPAARETVTPSPTWRPEIGFPISNGIGGGRVVVGVPVFYASLGEGVGHPIFPF